MTATPQERPEYDALLAHLKKHPEPGKWVVAVGPTMLVSMFNVFTPVLICLPSKQAKEVALQRATENASFKGMTFGEKNNFVHEYALALDEDSRVVDSGFFATAAVSAFNGLSRLWEESDGINVEHSHASGQEERHFPTVCGHLSYAADFELGSTESLKVNAWRLEMVLPELHKEATSLYPALTCWQFVTVDCRSSEPITEVNTPACLRM